MSHMPTPIRLLDVVTLRSAMPSDASIYHHADRWMQAIAGTNVPVHLTGFCDTAKLGVDRRHPYARVLLDGTAFVLTLPPLTTGGEFVETAVRHFDEADAELTWTGHPLACYATQPLNATPRDMVDAYLCAANWNSPSGIDLQRLPYTSPDDLDLPSNLAIAYYGPLALVIMTRLNPADQSEYLITCRLASSADVTEVGMPA